jgi:hypothetical protein
MASGSEVAWQLGQAAVGMKVEAAAGAWSSRQSVLAGGNVLLFGHCLVAFLFVPFVYC